MWEPCLAWWTNLSLNGRSFQASCTPYLIQVFVWSPSTVISWSFAGSWNRCLSRHPPQPGSHHLVWKSFGSLLVSGEFLAHFQICHCIVICCWRVPLLPTRLLLGYDGRCWSPLRYCFDSTHLWCRHSSLHSPLTDSLSLICFVIYGLISFRSLVFWFVMRCTSVTGACSCRFENQKNCFVGQEVSLVHWCKGLPIWRCCFDRNDQFSSQRC